MKNISTFVFTVLVFGFFFLAFPKNVYSGPPIIGLDACCQYFSFIGNDDACVDVPAQVMCPPIQSGDFIGRFVGQDCNLTTGLCEAPARNVPTLSEWVLIAMAGILGIVGFIVMRRRKATA